MQNFAPLNLVPSHCDGTITPLEVRGEFSYFLFRVLPPKNTYQFFSHMGFFWIMNWNTE